MAERRLLTADRLLRALRSSSVTHASNAGRKLLPSLLCLSPLCDLRTFAHSQAQARYAAALSDRQRGLRSGAMVTRAEQPAAVAFFREHGYCILPDVLSPAQVAICRDAVLRNQEIHAAEWKLFGKSRDGGPVGESGRWQSPTIMQHEECFDSLLALPAVLPMVRRLVGDTHGPPCLHGPVMAVVRAATVDEEAPRQGQTWPRGTSAVAPWPDDRRRENTLADVAPGEEWALLP